MPKPKGSWIKGKDSSAGDGKKGWSPPPPPKPKPNKEGKKAVKRRRGK